jgi:hypothetical protein
MFRQEYIEEVRQNLFVLNENKKKVIYLQKRLDDINKRLAELESLLEKALATASGSGETKDGSPSSVLTKERAQVILVEEAMRAIRGTEFVEAVYREGLLAAILLPATITFSIVREGAPNIKINLKETAGTTRDYANAVRKARKDLGVGKTRRVSKKRFEREGLSMASWFWKEKYYGPAHGKTIPQPIYKKEETPTGRKRKQRNYNEDAYKAAYERTLLSRASFFGKGLAPWWQLLDRGNPSAWSGGKDSIHEPYPTNSATNFVQKAHTRMKAESYKSGVDTGALDTSNQLKAVNQLFDAKKALEDAIKYIEGILANIAQRPLKQEDVIDVISRQLGIRLAKADKVKLQRLVDDITIGAPVPNRIRLGGGVRVGTTNIRKLLRSRGGR